MAISLARPIRELTEAMNGIAGGDLDTAVEGQGRSDEIGAMAQAVQVFKDNALALQQANAEAERLGHVTADERRRNEADQLPGELSRGMKQKLAIACGLLHGPQVMFFDEPLTGLDPLGIRRMKNSIIKRARDGAAIVLSSHLLHLLEEVCTHVLILKKGEKIADGTIPEVAARFSEGDAVLSLEDVFIRATGGTES